MYGEKKSHLYLWMEHYGYDMPANIYKMYSQPSRKTDDANKKVSVSASRTIKLNGSTGYDTNEQTTLITNGSSLSYPDEIKSASYADPISTKAYTNDSSVYDPGGASSRCPRGRLADGASKEEPKRCSTRLLAKPIPAKVDAKPKKATGKDKSSNKKSADKRGKGSKGQTG